MAFAVMHDVVRLPFVLDLHDPLSAARRALNPADFHGISGPAFADRLPVAENLLDLSELLADDAHAAHVELSPANHRGEIGSDAGSDGAFENDAFAWSLKIIRVKRESELWDRRGFRA